MELLTNAIVCVIPIASDVSIRSPDELLSSRVRLVAMGDPEHVPAGAYGKEALSSLGLWEALLPKMVPCANTRASLSHAEVSTVEAAILYSTDAQVSKKVKVAFAFPPTSHSRIVYPGVVLKRSANREAGRRFLAFLASPPAQAVFKRHGFKPVGETG